MHNLFRLIGGLRRDKRGNVAVIFAIACIPLISAIGFAVDYSRATKIRSKLQAAVDAASVGSIARLSPAAVAAAKMSSDGPIQDGVDDATKIFNGNVSGMTGYTLNSFTPTVSKTGVTIVSDIRFSADVPTMFLGVIGHSKMTVTGDSGAINSLPPFLDFYLMLDVSGSMGLPSTDAEQTRLSKISPDMFSQYPGGCTLACHFTVSNSCGDSNQKYPTNGECLGYWISRVDPTAFANLVKSPTAWNKAGTATVSKPVPGLPASMISGLPDSLSSPTIGDPNRLPAVSSCDADGTTKCIQLRADAVGYAVNQLFITANDPTYQKVPGQFRIGLFPFIRYLYQYFPLTNSINGDPLNSSTINYAAANLASQLDTNANTSLGSGGTHIDRAFSDLNTLITTVGNGSSTTNTQPFVFLVTDGAQDPQVKGVPNGSWSGSNHATVIDPVAVCTPLKDRGIVISVLYIPYQPIQNPNASFAGNEDGYANSNIPSISPSLQTCASPGFFYTANTPADITKALQDMFKHSLVTAHITN
jgi:hypothetical protein